MRNRYRGVCYRCGATVEAQQGHFEKVGPEHRKKWGADIPDTYLIQHAACAIRWRGTSRHWKLNPVKDVGLFEDVAMSTEKSGDGRESEPAIVIEG